MLRQKKNRPSRMSASDSSPKQTSLPFPARAFNLPFVVGSANRQAIEMVETWARKWESIDPIGPAILALTGPVGSGKSRLVQRASKLMEGKLLFPDENGHLPTSWDAKALCVDDAHLVEAIQLFTLYNDCVSKNCPLILVGRGALSQWGTGPSAPLPDLVSRLTAIPVVSLDAPTEEMMAEALAGALQHLGLRVPETEVERACAAMCRRFSAVDALLRAVTTHANDAEMPARRLLKVAMEDIPEHIL